MCLPRQAIQTEGSMRRNCRKHGRGFRGCGRCVCCWFLAFNKGRVLILCFDTIRGDEYATALRAVDIQGVVCVLLGLFLFLSSLSHFTEKSGYCLRVGALLHMSSTLSHGGLLPLLSDGWGDKPGSGVGKQVTLILYVQDHIYPPCLHIGLKTNGDGRSVLPACLTTAGHSTRSPSLDRRQEIRQ